MEINLILGCLFLDCWSFFFLTIPLLLTHTMMVFYSYDSPLSPINFYWPRPWLIFPHNLILCNSSPGFSWLTIDLYWLYLELLFPHLNLGVYQDPLSQGCQRPCLLIWIVSSLSKKLPALNCTHHHWPWLTYFFFIRLASNPKYWPWLALVSLG